LLISDDKKQNRSFRGGFLVYYIYMHKRAFTLIELMVTVAIIAILTGVATVSYQGVRERARDAQRSNDLNQLKISLTSY
jgi:prepilin-type N-terminal cleavage/methylation domain-containing protein